MFVKLEMLLKQLAVYLQDNPGVVTTLVGILVAFGAHFGLHLSAAAMTWLLGILLPLVAGGHLLARRARLRRGAAA